MKAANARGSRPHKGRPQPSPRAGPDRPGLAARRVAARLLGAVIDAHTPLDALTDGRNGHPQFLALAQRDRALVRAILVSALRYRCTIERLVRERLERPLPANARALANILHVGATQILFLDVPDSAAVDLAVTHAASDPRTTRFARLVNAVLRNIARGKEDALPKALAETRDAPDWFIERLTAAYGRKRTEAILEAHRVEPPVDFSVKSDPAAWAARLGGKVLPNGSVRIQRLQGAVTDLPGYEEGSWWVQDAAASLPARLLGEVRGLSVADLCAAPGGKTAQLAAAGARVTAVDQSASRLRRLKENLDRLSLTAETIEADILGWQPQRAFDAVLLDAPCSSTGTIRRHPDVAWTKTPDDIEKLAGLQEKLLKRAVELVRPGGILVYANCSLDPLEGEALASRFVTLTDSIKLDPIDRVEFPGAEHFVAEEGWLRTTPGLGTADDERLANVDGFFAARFQRVI